MLNPVACLYWKEAFSVGSQDNVYKDTFFSIFDEIVRKKKNTSKEVVLIRDVNLHS